jgi:hypothetical protein
VNILVVMSIHIMYLLISMFNIIFGLIGWAAICLICMYTYRTKIVYTDKVEYSNKVFDTPINLFIAFILCSIPYIQYLFIIGVLVLYLFCLITEKIYFHIEKH